MYHIQRNNDSNNYKFLSRNHGYQKKMEHLKGLRGKKSEPRILQWSIYIYILQGWWQNKDISNEIKIREFISRWSVL